MTTHNILLSISLLLPLSAAAQQRSTSSLFLQTQPKSDVTMPFSINDEGVRYTPTWGLDQAWMNEQNLRKGINHMGIDNVRIGRSAFRITQALNDDGTLASDPSAALRRRSETFDIVGKELPLVLTCDQEAGTDASYLTNGNANVNRWAAMIVAHVNWLRQNTKHPVVGVSPFNEPDYWTKEEGANASIQRNVAKALRDNYPNMSDVNIVGGNTLNNDKAWTWFSMGKDYYEWGNTHQLAGSFTNYADYYKRLADLGKVGYNDEMHNTAEAMIGLEYGMTVGIWWGFDSRTRGEFCEFSTNGERIAYAEHRNNWTAASVYRHDDGRVKAFIGSSERQAYTTKYQLLSPDRDLYFDGEGPLRSFTRELPGGTGYSNGQTNAECVIDITWGEDVPRVAVTDGIYRIYNRATTSVISDNGNGNIVVNRFKNSTADNQLWNVHRCDPRIGGDYSFYDIELATNSKLRMNVLNFSTQSGANVMPWSANDKPSSNEQWYLEYAGEGFWYIRNRESALYLTSTGTSTSSAVNVNQQELLDESKRNRQQWRFLPQDVNYDAVAPATPEGLTANSHLAAVTLAWNEVSDADVAGYHVLRAEAASGEWSTIARGVTANTFTDNTCRQGTAYQYKVKAIDQAQNLSEASAIVEATPSGDRGLVACWTMEGTLDDASANMMDAVSSDSPAFVDGQKDGSQALQLTGNSFVQLPYEVADADELTLCAWVRWSGGSAWQRLFDFGNGTSQYLFLTPSNGSVMRLAVKNGSDEQTLDAPKLEANVWKHVAVTVGSLRTTVYVDGEEVASTTSITLRPSDLRTTLNYVGRSQFSNDPYFRGAIDELSIYNYALSADEVRQAMEGSLSGIDDVKSNSEPASDIYSLDGRRQPAPQRGLNIIGTRKVLLK
jgi:hypothetical protein